MSTKPFLFLALIIVALSFVQCSPTKVKFVKNTPFEITDSYYQEWVGGQPGVSGTIVQLSINEIADAVTPDSLFFRNRKAKIDIKGDSKQTLWVTNFQNEQKEDINMMENSVDEYGNSVPQKINSSFILNEGEVVISYYKNESIKYYKLTGVPKKETLFFPSVKPER